MIRPPLRRTYALAALLACLPGAVCRAQRTQPASSDVVPRELLVAVAQSGATLFMGGAPPHIAVGQLPADFASDLFVPANARVIGALYDNANMFAFLEVPGANDALRQRMDSELLARGWHHPPPPFGSYGGFRSYPMPQNTLAGSLPYCRGLVTLTVNVNGITNGTTNLVLREETNTRNSLCTPPEQRGIATYNPPVPLPVLYNPEISGRPSFPIGCASGPMNASSTYLGGPLAADSALAFYGRQLADSGWKRVPGSAAAVATWTRPDSTGRPVVVTLTISDRSGRSSCLEARMDVRYDTRQ